MSASDGPVLVTAATGNQGGATARALLDGGSTVRVLVRNPDAPNAKALAVAGAEVVVGDLDDLASLRAACDGVRAVFSMQSPTLTASGIDWSKERKQGKNLVDAALDAGVPTYVHTSTSGVDDYHTAPGWGPDSVMYEYWENKRYTCELVRNAGFESFTLILPSTFMNHDMFNPANFIDGRRLVTVIRPDLEIPLIAVEDIGKASAAAMNDPAKFNKVDLHLAGDRLTMPQIVALLSRVYGRDFVLESGTVEEASAAGLHPAVAKGLTTMNTMTRLARPEMARAYGLDPMRFETWLRKQPRPA